MRKVTQNSDNNLHYLYTDIILFRIKIIYILYIITAVCKHCKWFNEISKN